MVKRFEVWLVNLDPTIGSEIKKVRPALIVSPDEMNPFLNTVIIAPMTTAEKRYPTRIGVEFQAKKGFVACDQIRTIDKSRLITKLGEIDKMSQKLVSATLIEMFKI